MKKSVLVVCAVLAFPSTVYACDFLGFLFPDLSFQSTPPSRKEPDWKVTVRPKPQPKVEKEDQSLWKKFQSINSEKPTPRKVSMKDDDVEKPGINWKFWSPKRRGIDSDPIKTITNERTETEDAE